MAQNVYINLSLYSDFYARKFNMTTTRSQYLGKCKREQKKELKKKEIKRTEVIYKKYIYVKERI